MKFSVVINKINITPDKTTTKGGKVAWKLRFLIDHFYFKSNSG